MQGQRGAAALRQYLGATDRNFVLAAWTSGCDVRVDARQPHQLRELVIEFGLSARGQCVVKLGDTSACATVTCELVDPSGPGAKHGFFDVTARPVDATSTRSDLIIDVQSALEAALRTSGAVDTESLCVLPGRKVWSLAVVVTLLADDGNACDVAVLAAVSALRHFRRPDLTIRGDEVIVHPARERDPVPLSLHHVPIQLSAAILPDGSFVVDPSHAEAAAADSVLSVAVTPSEQVCGVRKRSGKPCGYDCVKGLIAVAKRVAPQIAAHMDAAIDADEKARKAAHRAQFEWARQRQGISAATSDRKRERD